ncbi:MAG: hypothetical protein ACLUEU_09825 [Oscillospiraceae bacterium]
MGTLVSQRTRTPSAAILEELTSHAEPERRDAIAHYARGNFAQAQFVARLEEVYQSAVRDFQIREVRPYEKNHGDSNLLVPQDRRSVAGGRRRLHDHPTPVDQEGTLERTLVSVKQFRERTSSWSS